jgi:anti-sigma B factor antagonist
MLFDYQITSDLNVQVVTMHGDLIDKNQSIALIEDISERIKNKQLKYVFDLGDLKYMNSTGLNVMINLFTKTRKEGGDVIIANVNKKINELLVITKLTTLFQVTDSIDKAIAKLK